MSDFPQLRKCPISGHSVLIAPGRAARPMTLPDSESKHRPPRHRQSEGRFCPFCPGNEWDTPDEVYAIRDSDWRLRIVPNKYPAVTMQSTGQYGIHDVVIPCRKHESNPVKMTDSQFETMVIAWRDRLRMLSNDSRLSHATIFQNVGAEAGASLEHIHSQIIATPFVPEAIDQEIQGHAAYCDRHRACFFCQSPGHLISTDSLMTVVCPRASRFAYETWIIPTHHASRFEAIDDDACRSLARALKSTLKAIDQTLHEPAYNLFIHTAPFRSTADYHWHVEIIPRTARAAGYEWGAGVFINTVDPKDAVSQLKQSLHGHH